MTLFLYRLGKIFAKHKFIVLTLWVLALIGVIFWAHKLNAPLQNNYSLPGTDAQTAQNILNSQYPQAAGKSATIVFQANSGTITSQQDQQYVATVLKQVATLPDVIGVNNPYQAAANGQTPNISQNGKVAMASVSYSSTAEITTSLTDQMTNTINSFSSQGQQVGVTTTPGGTTYFLTANSGTNDTSSEALGMAAAVVILLIAFGSVIAMGLPLFTALFGLGVGISTIYVLAHWIQISSIDPTIAAMIGLGVGIDYALFIVNRYRENLRENYEVVEAVGRAIGTAGQAVIVAGLTVIIALLGLLLIGIPIISSIAYAAAISVGVAIIIANTLLPALLSIFGRSIEKINVHKLFHRTGFNHSTANKWGKTVTKPPFYFGIIAIVIYVLLIIPIKDIQLGPPGQNSVPPDNPQNISYNIITQNFGVGYNGPLLLVEQLPSGQSSQQIQASIQKISTSISQTSGVVAVGYPSFNSNNTVAIQAVIPTTSPSSEATETLVNNLQDTVIPNATSGTGINIYIGGQTATFVDMSEKIAKKMPIFIATVVVLAFLLLMLVFRSLYVPFVAAIMNILSALATFGAMVAIFQWGWLKSLIGLTSTGPLVSYVPIMVFAILFGLSMDYEIFLVSRMRENFVDNGVNKEAIISGITKTARIILVAASIMFCVFASFNTQQNVVVKMFGTGLAMAIVIDVLLARMVLVPIIMTVGSSWTWKFPKWLQFLPDLHFEDSSVLPNEKTVKAKATKAKPAKAKV